MFEQQGHALRPSVYGLKMIAALGIEVPVALVQQRGGKENQPATIDTAVESRAARKPAR